MKGGVLRATGQGRMEMRGPWRGTCGRGVAWRLGSRVGSWMSPRDPPSRPPAEGRVANRQSRYRGAGHAGRKQKPPREGANVDWKGVL